jgi:hypothetical protein
MEGGLQDFSRGYAWWLILWGFYPQIFLPKAWRKNIYTGVFFCDIAPLPFGRLTTMQNPGE